MRNTFLLLLICGLLACKSTPVIKPVNAEALLNMRYMEATQQVRAEARFKPANGAMQVVLPQKAQFNGSNMKPLKAFGDLFVFDGASTPINNTHSFSWGSAENNVNAEMQLPVMQAIKWKHSPLTHQEATQMTWQGDPMDKGESIVLIWQDVKSNETVTTQAIGASAVSALDIPAFELKKVPVGKYKLTIVRKKLIESEQNGFAIKTQGEWYSKPMEMEMEL